MTTYSIQLPNYLKIDRPLTIGNTRYSFNTSPQPPHDWCGPAAMTWKIPYRVRMVASCSCFCPGFCGCFGPFYVGGGDADLVAIKLKAVGSTSFSVSTVTRLPSEPPLLAFPWWVELTYQAGPRNRRQGVTIGGVWCERLKNAIRHFHLFFKSSIHASYLVIVVATPNPSGRAGKRSASVPLPQIFLTLGWAFPTFSLRANPENLIAANTWIFRGGGHGQTKGGLAIATNPG
ncbi:uncharacterized protein BDR25DRAFT_356529 [Lindgomyces ingoldianus]|uniref:Uncharacterized protein n=1 Tax=Lindgomyces ingoldianus TaxID=673940 RepID=A0ACB6QQU7_9PLEO|nr:uncharacterized protein BDR25DRAFT_356529 [Lindgomyces ingoldianus]KAF2469286.1 hypothetical protein BDR25DRAFT_356529 [Lindgomyces ingoldianus]